MLLEEQGPPDVVREVGGADPVERHEEFTKPLVGAADGLPVKRPTAVLVGGHVEDFVVPVGLGCGVLEGREGIRDQDRLRIDQAVSVA